MKFSGTKKAGIVIVGVLVFAIGFFGFKQDDKNFQIAKNLDIYLDQKKTYAQDIMLLKTVYISCKHNYIISYEHIHITYTSQFFTSLQCAKLYDTHVLLAIFSTEFVLKYMQHKSVLILHSNNAVCECVCIY